MSIWPFIWFLIFAVSVILFLMFVNSNSFNAPLVSQPISEYKAFEKPELPEYPVGTYRIFPNIEQGEEIYVIEEYISEKLSFDSYRPIYYWKDVWINGKRKAFKTRTEAVIFIEGLIETARIKKEKEANRKQWLLENPPIIYTV